MSALNSENAFEINFATGQIVDIEQLRSLGHAFLPNGQHSWIISTVYGIDDPEKALDEMELGAENFIGISPIRCLLCNVAYGTLIRYERCPQRPSD